MANNILKGIKYTLVEQSKAQLVINYLKEFNLDSYNECYFIDNVGLFIPADALDHIIGEC